MTTTISRQELTEKMNQHARLTLVETLPLEDYRQKHLPGAIDLPVERVKELAGGNLPDKNAEIVVYCASSTCNASEKAADALTHLGYRNVRRYVGGKQEWADAGLPLETGA